MSRGCKGDGECDADGEECEEGVVSFTLSSSNVVRSITGVSWMVEGAAGLEACRVLVEGMTRYGAGCVPKAAFWLRCDGVEK